MPQGKIPEIDYEQYGYKKEDFTNLLFDIVNGIDGQINNNIFYTFPKLKSLFKGMLRKSRNWASDNKIIKYIVLAYDSQSPLQIEKDLVVKKSKAALMAGFETDSDGRFEDDVLEMIANRKIWVVRMSLRYVKFQNNLDYTHLIGTQEAYYDMMEQLGKGIPANAAEGGTEAKKKGVIFEAAEKMLERIKHYSKVALQGDTDIGNYVASFEVEEELNIRVFPEDYARNPIQRL